MTPGGRSIQLGNGSLELEAEVQFLNNNDRPAGFTEFFVTRESLEATELNRIVVYSVK